jgi:subtilisin-like proprotein convertase family protein
MRSEWVFRGLATRWLGGLSSRQATRKPRRRTSLPRSFLLGVESLEDRTLLSTIPAPVVSGQQFVVSGGAYAYSPSPSDPFGPNQDPTPNLNNLHDWYSSPTIAADPTNGQNLVAVASHYVNNTGNNLQQFLTIATSTDGGASWFDTQDLVAIRDPNLASNANTSRYAQITNPVVAFDRGGNFYVVADEHDAGNTSTAIVLYKFDFNGFGFPGFPSPVDIGTDIFGNPQNFQVLYQSVGVDPAFNPTLVVDTNLPSFADPTNPGSPSQTDPFANATGDPTHDQLYVAWSVNYPADTRDFFTDTSNTPVSPVEIAASSDGGQNFTTQRFLSGAQFSFGSSAFEFANLVNDAAPSLTVTQGSTNGAVAGGQVEGLFSTTPPNNQNRTGINHNSITDGGSGLVFQGTFPVPGGGTTTVGNNVNAHIRDALSGGGNGAPDIPRTTVFTINVPGSNFSISDLNLSLALRDDHLEELSAVLVGPDGQEVTLFNSHQDPFGNNLNGVGLPAGADMGFAHRGNGAAVDLGSVVNTVFDQQAARTINAVQNAAAPYLAHYRPEGTVVDDPGFPGFSPSLNAWNGVNLNTLAADSLNPFAPGAGNWSLVLTDNRNDGSTQPTQFLIDWSLNFTTGLDNQPVNPSTGTSDDTVAFIGEAAKGGVTSPYPNVQPVSPAQGLGPSPSIAVDNTLGRLSPFQGRLYAVYVQTPPNPNAAPDNTNVVMQTSDDGGKTWSAAVQVNQDNAVTDGFTGEAADRGRAHWDSTVVVDQATGTVLVQYSDARWDAAQVRSTNYLAASIDGGKTFSESFLNSPKQAVDAIQLAANGGNFSSATVTLEPIPNNPSTIGGGIAQTTFGFGDHQGLVVTGPGHTYSVWAGNLNFVGSDLIGSSATYAAGPRIVSGDMGPVTGPSSVTLIDDIDHDGDGGAEADDTVDVNGIVTADNDNDGDLGFVDFDGDGDPNEPAGGDPTHTVIWNGQTAADGTAEIDAIRVTFDRPVDVTSFTNVNQVEVFYHSPTDPPGSPGTKVAVGSIQPLDQGNSFGPGSDGALLAENFLIHLDTPQSRVGTYSYIVGPVGAASDIRDGIRTVDPTTAAIIRGNFMDQNGDGTGGQAWSLGGSVGDAFEAPTPTGTFASPFQFPFDKNTLPLIIPGPHIIDTQVVAPAANLSTTEQNLVLNTTVNAVNVTFDRDMNTSSFTAPDVLSVIGPIGVIPGPYTVTALSKRTFQIGFPTQQLSGTYTVTLDSNIQATTKLPDGSPINVDENLNAGLDVLRDTVSPGTASSTTSKSYSSTGTSNSVTIPPANNGTNPATPGKVTTTIQVPDNFAIQQLTLQLNITYQNDPDLTATLTAPDGTKVQLFSNVGSQPPHGNFQNTTFSDNATTPIQKGGPPFNGTFNPQFPLSVLNGHGSAGTWTLTVTNSGSFQGTVNNWSLTMIAPVPSTNLGEPVADQYTAHFRIWTQDPTLPLPHNVWTAAGGASLNGGGGSGRIGGIAVDPSDPSGNTVYIGGASGGIWKTTNFLTTDPAGPTYIPLTNFGPTNAINIGSIAVFGRNNDPRQSIVFAATGEGDVSSPGVGVLRSMDGGATWTLLDSSVNVDASGNELPISDPLRKHEFVGNSSFKILVDPTPTPTGGVIVYVAMQGTHGGVWRSTDTGATWTLVGGKSGSATDIVLGQDSTDSNGNLNILFAAYANDGVYFTTSASNPNGNFLNQMHGGGGTPLILDEDPQLFQGGNPQPLRTANNPSPNAYDGGASGRIVLAAPFHTGNPAVDGLYEGWLYAAVMTGAGHLDGLYLTKDFGVNWAKITFPSDFKLSATPTNDPTKPLYDVGGGGAFVQGNYDVSLVIDPTNPNVVYLGGTADGQSNSMIRVDSSKLIDAHAFVAFDNDQNDGGLQQNQTQGGINIKQPTVNSPANSFTQWALQDSLSPGLPFDTTPYLNLLRDPAEPFVADSTMYTTRISGLSNDDSGVTWIPFDNFLGGSTDHHRVISFVDPVTGQARFVWGDDQGVWTGVVGSDGTPTTGIGSATSVGGSRNGNLQITQFYYGAAQPSILAAQVAGALFYGQAQDDGFPASSGTVLSDGVIGWNGGGGDGGGVATDQTGGGTLFQYNSPCCGGGNTSFFLVNGVGRTSGLIQPGDNPAANQGEWSNNNPPDAGIAVNPIDPKALLVSSNANPAGRIFRSTDQGQHWFIIGQPGNLDNTHANALAFGAPAAGSNAILDDFIYAGTNGGRVFVTFSGGGGVGNQWTQLGAGPLDGTPVHYIDADPVRGSHDAYAVTDLGVYYMPDSSKPGATWQNITGNLFSITHVPFGDANLTEPILQRLTSLAVDWRYNIPDDPTQPNGPVHPLIYVGGIGGIFRSGDRGQHWTPFPDNLPVTQTSADGMPGDGAPTDFGYLPDNHVTQLSLSVGNINPTTGLPDQSTGPNLLYAATYGQGGFIIRLPDNSPFNLTGAGPKVISSAAVTATGATLPNAVNGAIGLDQIDFAFGGAIDPTTFDLNDVNVVGAPVQSLTSALVGGVPTATVTTSAPHGYRTGQVILISGANQAGYNGAYSITVTGPNSFTYRLPTLPTAPSAGGATMLNADSVELNSIVPTTVSGVTTATVTVNSPLNVSSITLNGSTATVTVSGQPHGLNTGALVTIGGATQAGYNGTFAITVIGPNQFTYQIPNPTGLTSPAQTTTALTATPDLPLIPGQPMTIMGALDPAYDGTFRIKSVLGPNTFTYVLTKAPLNLLPQTGNIIAATPIDGFVDQTTLFTPFTISTITRLGTTATVTTTGPHGFASGDTVTISGAGSAAFDGTFTITVTGLNSFTYQVPNNIAPNSLGGTATLVGGPTAHNLWQVGLVHQSAYGSYNLVVGPNLTDFSGRFMDQDGEDSGGGTGDAGDAFTGTFTIGGLQVVNIAPPIPVPVPTPPGLSAVTATFNAPVDPSSFTTGQVKLVGPNGIVPISTVTDITGVAAGSPNQHTVWQIALPTAQLVAGNYTLTIGTTGAPFVTDMGDFQGNNKQPLDQDEDGTLPPGTDDQFVATFTIGGLQVVSVVPNVAVDNPPHPSLSAAGGLSSASVTFSRDVAPQSFLNNPPTLTRLDGTPIVGETISLVDITVPPPTGQNPHNVWQANFSPALTTPAVYALNIGTGVTDSSGDHLTAPFTALFDVDGLKVVSVTPANGFTPPNISSVTATFNQAVGSSLDNTTVQLTGPNGNIPLTNFKPLNSPATQWEIDFAPQPTFGAYTITIGPGVKDLAGEPMNQTTDLNFGQPNDSFTSTFNVQALRVLNVVPNLLTDVPPVPILSANGGLSSAIVTFNLPVGANGFPNSAAVLTRPDGSTITASSVVSQNAPSNTVWVVTFPAQTTPGVYTLTIGPGVTDPGGNPMDQNLNNVFGEIPGDQFVAKYDIDGLAVTSVTPSGVTPQQGPGISSVNVTFNQAVGGNFDNTTVHLTGPNGDVPLTNFKALNAQKTQWEIDFAAQLKPGTYNLLIGPGVTDLAGEPMNQNGNLVFGEATDSFSSSFTVTGLRVISVKPVVTSAIPVSPGLSSATVAFNREVDPSSFTTADVTLALPNGAFLPQSQLVVKDITPTPASGPNPHNVWEVDFPQQTTPGVYTLTVGPQITDSTGTPMDQNGNLKFGEVGTGGNQGDQFVALLDVAGLKVTGVTPSGIVPASLSQLTITFNQGVKKTSINPGTVTLTGPNGPIQITQLEDETIGTTGAHDVWRADFAPQNTYGSYTLTVGVGVQDLAGNALNQNQDTTFGQAPADQFSSKFTIDGLRIVSLEPSAPVNALSSATFTFNQPVNPSQFRASDIRLLAPDGTTVIPITALSDITPVPASGPNPHNVWEVDFNQQTGTGTYTLIVPPTPLDLAGRALDQNDNGTPGEVPADDFVGQLVVGSPSTPPGGGGGGGGTTPTPTPTVLSGLDVTSLLQLQTSKVKTKGNKAVLTVGILNTSGSTIAGPFALAVGGLPKGAKLVGAAGVTMTQAPFGQPYVLLNFNGNQLVPFDGGIFKLVLRTKNHKKMHPSVRLLAGFPMP